MPPLLILPSVDTRTRARRQPVPGRKNRPASRFLNGINGGPASPASPDNNWRPDHFINGEKGRAADAAVWAD